MRGFLLGVFALAACSEDGIYIEVRTPEGMTATDVDLYLATAECQQEDGYDCSAVVGPRIPSDDPAASRAPVPGNVYYVDADSLFTAPVDGDGTAWFFVTPSTSQFVKTAVAVGRDGDTNTSVAILDRIDLRDSPQHLRVELRGIVDDHVRGQGPAVEVWRPLNDPYRCVAADVDGRVVYVVPRQDPDCDQVPDTMLRPECNRGEHLAIDDVGDQIDVRTCPVPRAVDGACVVGGRPCNEMSPDTVPPCLPLDTTICLPDVACTCDVTDMDCLAQAYGDDNNATRIDCFVEVLGGGGGSLATCPDLPVLGLQPFGLGPCQDPKIALLGNVLDGFAAAVTSSPQDGSVVLHPRIDGECTIGLEAPNASFDPGLGFPPSPIRTLIKLDVAPMTPGERFVILPLQVRFMPGTCTSGETACQLVRATDEHVEKCFLQ